MTRFYSYDKIIVWAFATVGITGPWATRFYSDDKIIVWAFRIT